MSRERTTDSPVQQPLRPTRAQRLAVVAFLAAFGLTIITVLWTSYEVRLARARHAADAAAPGENRTQAEKAGEPATSPAR